MAKDGYRNVGGSIVAGAEPGEEFEFPEGDYNIAALIEGGHIEALTPKDALVAQAKKLGIEGRSSMSKDELAAAVAETEAAAERNEA